MLPYSKAALVYAILRCQEEPDYKVLVSGNRTTTDEARLFIIAEMSDAGDYYRIKRATQNMIIFQNDSWIKFVPASDNARGNKANLVIFGDEVEDEILNTVFRPMEILDPYNRRMRNGKI